LSNIVPFVKGLLGGRPGVVANKFGDGGVSDADSARFTRNVEIKAGKKSFN
jgi:hypothetical protein